MNLNTKSDLADLSVEMLKFLLKMLTVTFAFAVWLSPIALLSWTKVPGIIGGLCFIPSTVVFFAIMCYAVIRLDS